MPGIHNHLGDLTCGCPAGILNDDVANEKYVAYRVAIERYPSSLSTAVFRPRLSPLLALSPSFPTRFASW